MCEVCIATQCFDPRRHFQGDGHTHGPLALWSQDAQAADSVPGAAGVPVGTSWGDTPSVLGDAGGVVTWGMVGAGERLTFFPDVTGRSENPDASYTFDPLPLIQRAFDEWSEVANIEFMQVDDPGGSPGASLDPDIRIFFGDITGQTIGFGFFPSAGSSGLAGDILLDTTLPVRTNSPEGFYILALHEIGHAIGLDHAPSGVMNARINPSLAGLQANDISGARSVYGAQDSDAPIYALDATQADLNINHSPDNIIINGNALANTIDGSDTGEVMNGGRSGDVLLGRGGDDLLFGQKGADTLEGGEGNDELRGGTGTDFVTGENGNDFALGGAGHDFVLGGAGNDELLGGGGRDSVQGNAGNDTLDGQWGRDLLLGGGGRDLLLGGDGPDTLQGGWGNDTLNGQFGDDVLSGEQASDTFVFEDGHGNDQITDFDASDTAEKIDLSALSALSSIADLDLTDPNAGAATQAGADVVIDTGGGNSITLIGVSLSALDGSDFIF